MIAQQKYATLTNQQRNEGRSLLTTPMPKSDPLCSLVRLTTRCLLCFFAFAMGCLCLSSVILLESNAHENLGKREMLASQIAFQEQEKTNIIADEARGGNNFRTVSGGLLESLLVGVDLYVIEGDERRGLVGTQARDYGVPAKVETVVPYTPNTESVSDDIIAIARDCKTRRDRFMQKRCRNRPRPRICEKGHLILDQETEFPIGPKVISCTLSHLKALKAACDKKNHRQIALVFEDDANFEPLLWWPEPLTDMVSELPADWTVVAAAPTNFNEPGNFTKQQYFCPHDGIWHYGAVAVVYNIGNPELCSMVRGMSPVMLHRNASIMCQPADALLFKEFGGARGAFSSRMPLFYFSKNPEQAEPGAMSNHSIVDAIAQRAAWESYVGKVVVKNDRLRHQEILKRRNLVSDQA